MVSAQLVQWLILTILVLTVATLAVGRDAHTAAPSRLSQFTEGRGELKEAGGHVAATGSRGQAVPTIGPAEALRTRAWDPPDCWGSVWPQGLQGPVRRGRPACPARPPAPV